MSHPSTTILSILGCFNELKASEGDSLFFKIKLATKGVLSKSKISTLKEDKNSDNNDKKMTEETA